MDKASVLQQLEFHYWATGKMLDACADLSDEQLRADTGGAFGSTFALLVHMLGAEDIWLNRWQGAIEVGFASPEDYTDLKHIAREWHGQRQRLEAFLTEADLSEALETRGTKHKLWEMVLHLVDHSSFHRGQVMHALRLGGVTPPQTNLIHYLRAVQAD